MTIRQKGNLLMMASGKRWYPWLVNKCLNRWKSTYPDIVRDKTLYEPSCLTTDLIELKPSSTITVEGVFSVSGNAASYGVFGSDLIVKTGGFVDGTFDYKSSYKYIIATTSPANYASLKIYQDDEIIFDGAKNPPKPET